MNHYHLGILTMLQLPDCPCRPNSSTPFSIPGGPSITILTGPVVSEARQVAGSWVSQVSAFRILMRWRAHLYRLAIIHLQVIRLWNGSTTVEADWTVGPIDMDDFQGKEVIARYSTGWASNATWYTDSNCREMQTRIRNYRPTWSLNVTEPVSGNYFPVNCGIQLNDETSGHTLTVVTDRSQGGSSMQDGALELMVHRR
jgi:lysosomal alpha-mannosidase